MVKFLLQINIFSFSRTNVFTETRNCVCIWDSKTGRILRKISESPLGAVIAQSVISRYSNKKSVKSKILI